MAHRHKLHHAHGAHAGSEAGWVEGITSLREGDRATSLLDEGADAGVTNGNGKPANGRPSAEAAPAGSAAAGNAPLLPPSATALGDMTPEEQFEALLEHATGVLEAEIKSCGEAVLEVGAPNGWGPCGLTEDQLALALDRVRAAADRAGGDVTVLRQRAIETPLPAGGSAVSQAADVLVRRRPGEGAPLEVRVAVIGNVDSGKSTLVGVLTRGMLDDGRGLARSKVFKHSHEESTGRTSSIGQHTLCLDAAGHCLNDALFRTQTCGDYVSRAAKVVTLVDLAGHEKYFRTTAYGLTGHLPDAACLLVGANMGVVGMCREHLGVALALKVPVFFVITKTDIAPEHVLRNTVQTLTTILKKPGVRKRPFLVRCAADVALCARSLHADSLAPIFLTSAVTGQGLDLVRLFVNLMPQRTRWAERIGEPAEFVIDETFGVPGVGTVVAGTLKKGTIGPNATLLLGPDIADGAFRPVAVKSLHYKRLPVAQVVAGQTAALALKKIKRSAVRKGMVLAAESLKPKASWEFDADIAILTHSTTIQPRYQAVIHCEIIRQAARVVAMDRERLRSGDRACVRFRFLQRPEYVTPGTRFVFREGRTKGIGLVVGTEHDSPSPAAAAAKMAAAAAAAAAGEGGAAAPPAHAAVAEGAGAA